MKQEKRKKSGNLRRLAQYYKPYRGLFFSDMFFAVLGAATSKGCGRTRDVEGYNVANALSAKLYAQFCDRFQTPLCCELTGVKAGDGAAQAKFLAGGGHARVCEVCVREACEMALRLIDEHAQKTHNE